MKYQGCLLAVKDISVSKHFYEKVLHQNALMDIGVHVTFEGFSLQQGYAEIIGIAAGRVKEQSHNLQVYFEVEDLDKVYAEMKNVSGLMVSLTDGGFVKKPPSVVPGTGKFRNDAHMSRKYDFRITVCPHDLYCR